MARSVNRLSARSVTTIKDPGRHADGGNLYLSVSPSGSRSWVFMYVFNGRQREMGLGPARDVSLAEARDLAAQHRRSLRAGLDPIESRRTEVARPSFGAFAEMHIASMEASWRNPKHRAQWRSTLATYAAPLAKVPVDAVTTADVLAVLKPIWSTKAETASRVRGRIESVLDAAKAAGHRTGDNPAAWRGHLDQLLPRRSKRSRGHHAAMAIDDMPGFMARLRDAKGLAARALEFTILTAARTSETLEAPWTEVNTERALWTIPAERMKAERDHRVPLTDRAVEILEEMRAIKISDFVFPGSKLGRPLSNMAMDMVLRRLGHDDVTVHGFRSTFKDWAAERTHFPNELSEMALAHAIGDQTEAAYRRGDLFEKRRALMEAWAHFLQTPEDVSIVVPLRPSARLTT
jgi:integrase